MLLLVLGLLGQATTAPPNSLVGKMELAGRPFLHCVRDNSVAWASSTKEPIRDVVDAAIASCTAKQQQLRRDFIEIMKQDGGVNPIDAELAWNETLPQLKETALKVGLTAAMNARTLR